jgi:hypothetical protein
MSKREKAFRSEDSESNWNPFRRQFTMSAITHLVRYPIESFKTICIYSFESLNTIRSLDTINPPIMADRAQIIDTETTQGKQEYFTL